MSPSLSLPQIGLEAAILNGADKRLESRWLPGPENISAGEAGWPPRAADVLQAPPKDHG